MKGHREGRKEEGEEIKREGRRQGLWEEGWRP